MTITPVCPMDGSRVRDDGTCATCGKTPAEVAAEWQWKTDVRKADAAAAHERIAAYIAEKVAKFAAFREVPTYMVDADLRSETSIRTGGARIYVTLKVKP